jgi:hypothetical protein
MCLLESAELNQDDIVSGVAMAGAVVLTHQVFVRGFPRPVDSRGAISGRLSSSRGLSMGNGNWRDSTLGRSASSRLFNRSPYSSALAAPKCSRSARNSTYLLELLGGSFGGPGTPADESIRRVVCGLSIRRFDSTALPCSTLLL